ncbi:hypothetical protein CXB51_019383 [Gossypium anomalum]|uniref:DUF4283 domain-containing protein n=1 Tax=Gossypium anomalum TaxID=47600 RepID=A0A8J5YZI5_9ROSI|nr:hypothetical protein CXB51_019383 [Gossypium anomalum]
MAEDINVLQERLNFSEEESRRVTSTNMKSITPKSYEAWAVGKIMSKERINRKAIYRVLKSLWFTKEEVNFVALDEGVIFVKFGAIEDRRRILNLSPWLFDQCLFALLPFVKGQDLIKYAFNITPFWTRIYNIPFEQMDRQVAVDVGEAIGEVLAIDWRDRDGGWIDYIRLRIKIDMLKPFRRMVHLVGSDGLLVIRLKNALEKKNIMKRATLASNMEVGSRFNYEEQPKWEETEEIKKNHNAEISNAVERNGDDNDLMRLKEKEKNLSWLEENLRTFFHLARRWLVPSPAKSNETSLLELLWTWESCDTTNPNVIFLCETKKQANNFSHIRSLCRMDGCLVVNSNGRSGGLAMIWKEGFDVAIQNYYSHYIDSLVRSVNHNTIRFIGFYGHAGPNLRFHSWHVLRRVERSVGEDWIVGGDFNAIANDAEKEGDHRKSKVSMKEFIDVLEKLSLVDVKTTKGWFTWVNNREGNNMLKERLDRFLISTSIVDKFPFIDSNMVRQSNSDHNAIVLDTLVRKPRDNFRDPRLLFKYDVRNGNNITTLEKLKKVGKELGQRQHRRYSKIKNQIRKLVTWIDNLIDSINSESNANMLK